MDCAAVDCTPDKVLEEMGLKRKGDLYGLKAMCARKTRSQKSDERESTKRKLVEEILKEKDSRKKRKASSTSTCTRSSSATAETSTKPPKTRRISLGLMLFDESKNKFVTVRYSRGGGTRSLDVPILMTKPELIEEGTKLFFPNGVSQFGNSSDYTFDIACFRGEIIDKLKDSDGQEVPFTVKGYFECFKLSRVQLYLTCKRLGDTSDDDDDLLKSMLEPSTSSSNSKSSTRKNKGRKNKGKSWRQNITTQLENERKMWRILKRREEGEEEEEKKNVDKDRKRQEALEGEIAEIGRLEAIRYAREARVSKEPGEDSSRVRMLVQHPSLGRIERFFSRSEKMTAVYDWVGSLELHPSYFTLCVPPATTILPEEDVVAYDSLVIDVRPSDEPLLLSISSPEVTFKGFGSTSSGDRDNIEFTLLSSSPDAIARVNEHLPDQIMELDVARFVKSGCN